MANDLLEKKESRQRIIFNEKYEFKWDGRCWILSEIRIIEKGENAGKKTIRQSYHASLPQIANAIIEREAGNCLTMQELRDLFADAVEQLTKHLEGIA